jgi:hypothetical protein
MDKTVLTVVRLALEVLSERVLTILALFMSFILACWAMYDPTLERVGMGTAFSLFSYLMVKVKEKTDERPERP